MKKLMILSLAVATPELVEAANVSPTEAASMALKQCILHVQGAGRIEGGNGRNLEIAGFAYQREPPEFLASTKDTPLGWGEYVRAPSSDGEVWAIGYNMGGCMVVTLGTQTGPVEAGYKAVFDEPGTWRKSTAPSAPAGQRNERYQFNPQRTLKLTAMVNYQDGQGVSSVTLTRAR